MTGPAIDSLPGFRRRFVVTPQPGRVTSAVEDDFHCMAVEIHHDSGIATGIEPLMERSPWTTCPGAIEQLKSSFTGAALEAFPARAGKTLNCTHLYDLALLGAAHAHDAQPLVYDVLVSDPDDGQFDAELRRDGGCVMRWTFDGWAFVAPAELAGLRLDTLGEWIGTLDPAQKEAARILRWATMIAHGRQIPLDQQSDATKMPPNCHTFQPHNAAKAIRVGRIKDFANGPEPLERHIVAGPDGGLMLSFESE